MIGTPESCAVTPVPSRSKPMVSRISLTTSSSLLVPTMLGSSARTISVSDAVIRQELAAQDLVRHDPLDEGVVFGPSGSVSGKSGPGTCPFSGAVRAEKIEMTPRGPSISCRSVTTLRRPSTVLRSNRLLPSTTTSTSNSLEGKRCVTSSNWRNSGVSERNSWLSESSTLMRVTPNPAAIASRTRMHRLMIGARSARRPIRSAPKAR